MNSICHCQQTMSENKKAIKDLPKKWFCRICCARIKNGDIVSFDQEGVTIYLMVLRISRNKVTVLAENRKRYTVPAMALLKENDKGDKIQKKIQAIIDKEVHDVMKGLRSLK